MITKVALNALKMRAPFLSESALKKVQDAGMIKSVKELVPGWQEGSKNLAKRYNADITTLPEQHPIMNTFLRAKHVGAVNFPNKEILKAEYDARVPNFIKKHFTRNFEKTVDQLPDDVAIIARNAKTTGNARKDLMNNTATRHELLEAKYNLGNKEFDKTLKSLSGKFFISPEEVQKLKTVTFRKRPDLWTKYNNDYALAPTSIGHASAHVLRGERKFLMESGHPELAKGSLIGKVRANTGEANSLRKITGNDEMFGSMAKNFDASKYIGATNGELRKQLSHDDRALRRYIDKKELTHVNGFNPGNMTYTMPGDPGPGFLRDKLIPWLEKRRMRTQ